MSGLLRKSALLATTAALAFSGVAASAVADSSSGHHEHWTAKQCANQSKQWKKAHKHPTAKQTKQENKLLKKHDCTETV
jgi:hypothetical protein